MRFLSSLFTILVITAGVSAQASLSESESPKIELVQKGWHIVYSNPNLDEDPFRAVDEHNQQEIDKKATIKNNEVLVKQGKSPELPPSQMRPMDNTRRDPRTSYIYEVKFKNNGQKEIRTISWDYVFFEPETKEEVGRRQFVSKTKIEPGKAKTLIMSSGSPPTETVDAGKNAQKADQSYFEQVEIRSIEYADGSIWKFKTY